MIASKDALRRAQLKKPVPPGQSDAELDAWLVDWLRLYDTTNDKAFAAYAFYLYCSRPRAPHDEQEGCEVILNAKDLEAAQAAWEAALTEKQQKILQRQKIRRLDRERKDRALKIFVEEGREVKLRNRQPTEETKRQQTNARGAAYRARMTEEERKAGQNKRKAAQRERERAARDTDGVAQA